MLVFLRRVAASYSVVNPHIVSLYFRSKSLYPLTRPFIDKNEENSYRLVTDDSGDGPRNNLGGIHSLSLLCQDQSHHDKEIKVVDLDTWSISAGLSCVSKSEQKESQISFGVEEVDDGIIHDTKQVENDPDFDGIEDMRIHGDLFYKIERNSMEFQEYKFDFHGRKPKYNANDEKESKNKESQKDYLEQNDVRSLKGKVNPQEINKKPGLKDSPLVNKERLVRSIKEQYVVCSPRDIDASLTGKKLRSPTFNQLTGPFHEPFCLDIHVSKGSVRACVVHRVTSKVVTVSHSISKDMKFDLGSTKSRVAAAAVGKVLAQRALADDIHDVIYTPRKGDKLEGKLQIVLQSIIDNGVNVKIRLRQKSSSKPIKRPPVDEKNCVFELH